MKVLIISSIINILIFPFNIFTMLVLSKHMTYNAYENLRMVITVKNVWRMLIKK